MLAFDLMLQYPADSLFDVPIPGNPHAAVGHTGHTCYYMCSDFSTVGSIVMDDLYGCFMYVESEHPAPVWGEPVTLMSTSAYIMEPPWQAHRNNIFALFRNKYWRVSEFESKQDWRPGAEYPLTDGRPRGPDRRFLPVAWTMDQQAINRRALLNDSAFVRELADAVWDLPLPNIMTAGVSTAPSPTTPVPTSSISRVALEFAGRDAQVSYEFIAPVLTTVDSGPLSNGVNTPKETSVEPVDLTAPPPPRHIIRKVT